MAGTTAFPAALDSHSGGNPYGFAVAANNLQTELVGTLTAAATTVTVISTTGFPTRGLATVDEETFSYTGTTADTFTGVTRGADGTTAVAHVSGSIVAQVPVAANHNDLAAAIVAVESVLAGRVVSPNAVVDPGLTLWPEGTSFAAIADGTWGPAGLIYRKAGAAVHTLSRSTDVPAVAALTPLANYSCQLDVTTADTSIAAGDFAAIATRIEGYDWVWLAQRAFTLPFWVKAAKAGIHYVYARNSGNDRSVVLPYTVAAADTWERHTVTVPASPSAGTWNYTNGRGLEIGWTQYVGSTFHVASAGAVGSWQTGDFYGYSDQVNEVDDTANNFRIAMIGPPTVGSYAAPFVALPYPLEELRAARYITTIGGASAAAPLGVGMAYLTTAALVVTRLPVHMRASPSFAVSNGAHFSLTQANLTATATTSLAIFVAGDFNTVGYACTLGSAVLVAGNATILEATNAAAQIKFTSRIP